MMSLSARMSASFSRPRSTSSPLSFLKEKAKGRLANSADPQRMADFCLATIQGGMLMGKVKRSSEPVEAASREAVAHVRSYVVKSSRSMRRRLPFD